MKARKISRIRLTDNLWGYAFVFIPLLGMAIFVVIPFCMTLYSGFTNWPLGQSIFSARWIGVKNYVDMFKNQMFWKSLSNTFYYMLGIPIGIALSLLLAALMNRNTPGETIFRVIYYTPVITSVVAVSFVFQRLFMTDGGIVNTYLQFIGITNPPRWLSDPRYTKWVIIVMTVWKGIGGSIILYIAGMQGISPTFYEAAQIDGASPIYIFRKITFPLLMPVTFYMIVTSIIGGAQIYVEPRLIFTDNGPANSTFSTVIYLYDHTFRQSRAGYGSAIAMVLSIIVFIVTAIQLYINGQGAGHDRKNVKKNR